MIGIVLVTHGSLAQALVDTAQHIMGPQRNFIGISVDSDQDMENARSEILQAIEDNNPGSGVVLVTDLFGGTPSNLAISAIREDVEAIAGVNLPLLLKLLEVRGRLPLKPAVLSAQEAGRKYIHVPSELLK